MMEIQPWKVGLIATMLVIVALVASCIGSTPFPVSPLAPTLFFVDNTLTADCPTYSLSQRNCSGADGTAYTGLNHAIQSVPPDSVLQVRQGIYRESAAAPNGSKPAYYIGKMLTVQSYMHEDVTLTYGPRPDDGHGNIGAILAINANGVVIDGLHLIGTHALVDNGQGDSGVDSDITISFNVGASGTIRNNTISDNGHAGVKYTTLGGPMLIENNDIGPGGFAARDHGVYVASIGDDHSQILRGNTIHDAAGYGVHIYGSQSIHGVIVQNNTIERNRTGGLLLVGTGHIVVGNSIVDNAGGPFQRGGISFFHYGLTGLRINGNTITGNKPADIDCQLDQGTAYGGNDFSGNVFGSVKGGGQICQDWQAQQGISPTPSPASGTFTPTATPTESSTPQGLTVTPSLTATATASLSPTATDTLPPYTETPTFTPSPTSTPAPSTTSTPTLTASSTPTTTFPRWECRVLGVTPEAANKFIVVTECDPP